MLKHRNDTSNAISFTVLPYVEIQKPLTFGQFSIWPDNCDNWKVFLNHKRPARLLNIYVDRLGKKIDNKTIISSHSVIERNELNKLIAVLYFLSSNNSFQHTPAESFYSETFYSLSRSKSNSNHTRVDKFCTSLIASSSFKVYQPYEATRTKIDIQNKDLEQLSIFKNYFTSVQHHKILSSLVFYFKTQYNNADLFPEIDDIKNFATAFEIFFEVDEHNTGAVIAEKLFSFFNFADSLNREKLKVWFVKFYEIRGKYTHGKPITHKYLRYGNQRHIDIAKQIFCSCIHKYTRNECNTDIEQLFETEDSLLTSLFSSQEIFDNLVKKLTPFWGSSHELTRNFQHLRSCELSEINTIGLLMYKFQLDANRNNIINKNRRRLLLCLKTLLTILQFFIEEKSNNKFDKHIFTEILDEIKKLPLVAKDDQELKLIYITLNNPILNFNEIIGSFDDMPNLIFRDQIRFRNIIEIQVICTTFAKLFEIYAKK